MLISTLIDEFGFDRIERTASPQAANLLYKIIDARSRKRSTALVTNIDFDAWGDYSATHRWRWRFWIALSTARSS